MVAGLAGVSPVRGGADGQFGPLSEFKDLPWAKRQHSLTIIVVTLLIGAIIKYSEDVLILIAGAYFLTGWDCTWCGWFGTDWFAHCLKCLSRRFLARGHRWRGVTPRSGPENVDGRKRLSRRRSAALRRGAAGRHAH